MERSALPLCVVLLAAALLAPDARAQFESEDFAWPDESAGLAGAVCSGLAFADDFEIGTACRWSSSPGWTGVCPGSCGDGTTNPGEVCDDGNQITETQCPYGTIFCTACDATCTTANQLIGPFCGDGNVAQAEECDDGNMVTEAECPYGAGNCALCTSDCLQAGGQGDFCGDGTVNAPYEDCDDGNANACGTCSADCQNDQSAYATGMLVVPAGASLVDGETFTLDDGLGTTLVFEFDSAGGVTGGHVPVPFTVALPETQVRNNCFNAIVSAGNLQIDASPAGSQIVMLVHERSTSAGNVAVAENVATPSFSAFGMSGGQGGNCGLGFGCVDDDDCLSGFCFFDFCDIP